MNNSFKKRIDELGRIVIPKEIRNTFKIQNYDEVELFIEGNSIIVKKTIGLERFKNKFLNLVEYLKQYIKYDIILVNSGKIIVSSNETFVEKDEININLSKETSLEGTTMLVKNKEYKGSVQIEPLILESNLLGHLIILSDTSLPEKEELKNLKKLIVDLMS